MPRLILIKGADEGRQFELTQPLHSVGRDSTSHIRLYDTEVSRRHAEFRLVDDVWHLVDVGSANGTFVNGQPVKDTSLHAGDRVQIGQSILVFSAGRGDAPSTSDLANRISMITRHDMELSSAIVKTIGETEGSRLLAQPDQVQGPWLKNALANLAVMYEASQAVSHILDINQLLERIVDLLFRCIEADRGCAMVRNSDSNLLEPKAVRWRQGSSAGERMSISSTIVEYVLREKKGVLVSDAARDERFASQSIVRFGIREVICVPMKGRHETLGVLYVDTVSSAREVATRAAPGKFTEDHLALAGAIAHQAALAVEESRYHQAMVQAERLAAIGQTIAALSHHIKNILQGLRSGGELLEMGLADKEEPLVQKGWKIVRRNQGKIADLVMDMLSYSKDREPAVEDCDLNELVREVLETVQGRTRELGVHVEAKLDELPPIPVDPQGFHHALLNVVSNAIDAVEGRPDGRVALATYLEPDGAWARVLVQDNGVGIASGRLPDIFKPFVSTKGAKGTGLGLPVSRKILREHGGDILVQSQVGKGSRFLLRLPVKSPLSAEVNSLCMDSPPVPPPEE